MENFIKWNSLSVALLVLVFLSYHALVFAKDSGKLGLDVYKKYCVGCHGEKGDGKGKGAALLVVKPRDFTRGIFKFKSTPIESLPTDEDLMRTITKGLPGSSMPNFELVQERERRAVIAYIKTFSKRWKAEKPKTSIIIPDTPRYIGTSESILKGKDVFEGNGCAMCHGEDGDVKGDIAEDLEDEWGNPIRARNFQIGIYRNGSTPGDIFRTLSTGLEGTPMPEFSDLPGEERWHLISYILSLKTTGGRR